MRTSHFISLCDSDHLTAWYDRSTKQCAVGVGDHDLHFGITDLWLVGGLGRLSLIIPLSVLLSGGCLCSELGGGRVKGVLQSFFLLAGDLDKVSGGVRLT